MNLILNFYWFSFQFLLFWLRELSQHLFSPDTLKRRLILFKTCRFFFFFFWAIWRALFSGSINVLGNQCKDRWWEQFIVLLLSCRLTKKCLYFCLWVICASGSWFWPKHLHAIGDYENIWSYRGDSKMEYLGCHIHFCFSSTTEYKSVQECTQIMWPGGLIGKRRWFVA